MSDITKCTGANEPKCETCYRKTAISNEYRQSYFIQVPMQKNGECDEYWESEKELDR
jgi:hypothetical protein